MASTTRCCSGRSRAWSCWPRSESLMTLFIGFELLSIPLYVLCATHLHRRTSLEAGLKYLVVGSVGSATLLYGLALVYGATGALRVRRDRDGARQRHGEPLGPAAPDRRRALRDGSRIQGLGGALPPVDAGRLRGRAHADHHLHGGGHQGGRVRRLHPALRPRARAVAARLGAGARRARRGDDRDRQRRRDPAAIGEAHARVVERRAGRLPAGGRRGRHASSACARRRSTWPSTC